MIFDMPDQVSGRAGFIFSPLQIFFSLPIYIYDAMRYKRKWRRPRWLSDFLILAIIILLIVLFSIRKDLG
jgi:hypothetical protein